MDQDGHVLLTDFGISKWGKNGDAASTTFCGSPMYLAPEMLSRSGHGPSLDWYSLGALTYELLTGLPPYYTNDKKQLFHNILQGFLPIPDYLSPSAVDFVTALLHRDPALRLGSGKKGVLEIQEHPFLRHISWKDLLARKVKPPIKPHFEAVDSISGLPDLSHFPQAFTEQAISDAERGLGLTGLVNEKDKKMMLLREKERKLFSTFDFQPKVNYSEEAMSFEASCVREREKEEGLGMQEELTERTL